MTNPVEPQPGEIWQHEHHGKVKIIRKWNEEESICELLENENRRVLLMNCLMKKVATLQL